MNHRGRQVQVAREAKRKPAKAGAMWALSQKRPEEAPFAALRPHGLGCGLFADRPAAKPTRPIISAFYFTENNRIISIQKMFLQDILHP